MFSVPFEKVCLGLLPGFREIKDMVPEIRFRIVTRDSQLEDIYYLFSKNVCRHNVLLSDCSIMLINFSFVVRKKKAIE